ncbi:hypothetical protein UlMin_040879 [Ulmus minor]
MATPSEPSSPTSKPPPHHLLQPTKHNHPLCHHQLGRGSSCFTISSPQCQFPLNFPTIYRPRRPRAWRNQLLSQTHLQGILFHCSSPLSQTQAINIIATAQANFIRIIIQSDHDCSRIGVELLCVVKVVLKKIKRRVLVRDDGLVGSIDRVDCRGMCFSEPPRSLIPMPEPFILTRFQVEAESTGIPLTLAMKKLHSWGYEPLFCSVESKYGLDSLAFILRDQTTMIMGPSGVGKSSLINALRNNRCGSVIGEDNWFDTIGWASSEMMVSSEGLRLRDFGRKLSEG